jgi:Flp pilus assembly protein TadD
VLRGVVESRPDRAEARLLLGRMLLAQGDAAEAVVHLEAAARSTPDDADVREQLGRAYEKLGKAELAREQFEASRQLRARRSDRR